MSVTVTVTVCVSVCARARACVRVISVGEIDNDTGPWHSLRVRACAQRVGQSPVLGH